jgi:glycosyltransferase involved in cell wall biosynthesis
VSARPDVALDTRETSHLSAGMRAYVRALRDLLPVVAPDLSMIHVGAGDNFDLAEQVGIPLALLRARPCLAHIPSPYVPRWIPVPYVVTVHDVIDLEFPQYAKRKVGPYWRHIVAPVLRGARAVVVDDERTAALLPRYTGVDPARVRVIPLGVDAPEPLPSPVAAERPYLFYAGNQRPHKDLPTLLRAWRALPDALAVDLVLTGPENAALRALARPGGALVFAGELDETALWTRHRGAAAYVHPALREGFGLPLLEAVRAGTPVIAADAAVPRVLTDEVTTYPAGDVDALTAALTAVLTDPQARERAAAARARTQHYTWARTVATTAALYRELLA